MRRVSYANDPRLPRRIASAYSRSVASMMLVTFEVTVPVPEVLDHDDATALAMQLLPAVVITNAFAAEPVHVHRVE